jgi:hypothetical protein
MKRRDLVSKLERAGCKLIRHDGKHDWYRNPETGFSQPQPGGRTGTAETLPQSLACTGVDAYT